jgi:hypothetical protein
MAELGYLKRTEGAHSRVEAKAWLDRVSPRQAARGPLHEPHMAGERPKLRVTGRKTAGPQ